MTSTLITLGISLAGLSSLYAFKSWELSRGSRVAPRARRWLDAWTLRFVAQLVRILRFFQALPHLLVYAGRRVAFIAALLLAAIARGTERRAHNLARIIAHPYRRPGRNKKAGNGSAFLQEVAAHKETLDPQDEREERSSQR